MLFSRKVRRMRPEELIHKTEASPEQKPPLRLVRPGEKPAPRPKQKKRMGFMLKLFLVLFAAGWLWALGQFAYDRYVQPFNDTADALAEVGLREGSVLDLYSRSQIMAVELNRALHDRGTADFFSKVRRAAGGGHKNHRTNKPFPEFSGIATKEFDVYANEEGWNETLGQAKLMLLQYWLIRKLPQRVQQVLWQPVLSYEYLFYHNVPVPSSFVKANPAIKSCDRLSHKGKKEKNGHQEQLQFCRV